MGSFSNSMYFFVTRELSTGFFLFTFVLWESKSGDVIQGNLSFEVVQVDSVFLDGSGRVDYFFLLLYVIRQGFVVSVDGIILQRRVRGRGINHF